MKLNNFNDLVEKLKEIVPDYQQTDDDYYFDLKNNKCSLVVEINNQFFYVKINYRLENKDNKPDYDKQLSYQGVFHELTFFYIYTMFNTLKNYPHIFTGVFFGTDDTELNVLMERLQFAIIEYDAFLKNFLDKEEWGGEPVKVAGLKNCEIMVEINDEEVPYIIATFTKGDRVFDRMFTMYEWLLLLVEEMSWLEADNYTVRVQDLPKPPEETKDYIGQILQHYGADIKNIGNDYIDVPITNQYVLKVLIFFNNLGIVVKLYTSGRPFSSYDIKIPYRHNIIDNINYLSKILYLIQEDKEGKYVYSLLNYFTTIKDIYAKVLI